MRDDPTPTLGVELTPDDPIPEVVDRGVAAEDAGYDIAFVSCHYNNRDPFATLARLAGETDRDGRELGVTVENVVDELAAAANLVAGEGDGGTPAVVVREFEWGDHAGSDEHFREIDTDYVRQAIREWSYA